MKKSPLFLLIICCHSACVTAPVANDAGDGAVEDSVVASVDVPARLDRVATDDSPTTDAPVIVDAPERACTLSVMPRWSGAMPSSSLVVAPGRRLDDLRADFAANAASQTLLTRARARARPVGPPTLAPGDDAGYQDVSSTTLAHALVAWYDRDEQAAQRAAAWMSALVVTPQWLARAPEVMIRVGASLVLASAALDLLAAAGSASFEGARRNFALASMTIASWVFSTGSILVAGHPDNHSVRMGGGLIAALPWTSEAELGNRVERVAVSMVANAVATQNRTGVGWAEGSMYLQYALETPAISLAMLDALWTAPTPEVCMRCVELQLAPCGFAPVSVSRPRAWPQLQQALGWLVHLQTARGQIVPVDDSRYRAPPAPLFERLTGQAAYPRWSAESFNGSVGQSHDVGPVLAFAALESRPAAPPARSVVESAGTSLLHHPVANGPMIEVALTAEPMAAIGNGHEHDDPLSTMIYVNGETMLGGSGYFSYDTRGPYAATEAHSLLTVEGVFPRVMEYLPSSLNAVGDNVIGSWTSSTVTVQRNVGFVADDVVVNDTVTLERPQTLHWYWHTRGMLDAGRTDRWTSAWSAVDRASCELQPTTTLSLTPSSATGMHVDDNPRPISHVVLQFAATAPAGISTVRWTFRCR
jgi:hypothetical protein